MLNFKVAGNFSFLASVLFMLAGLVMLITTGNPIWLGSVFAFFVAATLSRGLGNDFMDAMVVTLVAVGILVGCLYFIDARWVNGAHHEGAVEAHEPVKE